MEIEIIVPNRFYDEIKKCGFHGNNESGAWLLFSSSRISRDTWSNKPLQRFILREIHPLTSNDIESSSPTHLTVKTESFIPVIKNAQDGFVSGFLHGHPSGYGNFSETDDQNEKALLSAAINRNGKNSKLVSLLILPDGTLLARCWLTPNEFKMTKVKLTGDYYHYFSENEVSPENKEMFDRQIRLFGENFNKEINQIKVLVIGAGGTGSPLAIMLARAGVKKIVIIDPDSIELTNLHRLHGSNICDIGQSKAKTLAKYIESIGLGNTAMGIKGNILQSKYQDLLKSADVIFVATDDHAGRMLLNRFAYFYETTVIDLGLASAILPSRQIQDLTGRVTVLYPGSACLLCRGIIDSRHAREEELKRRNPKSYNRQLKEGYVLGGGDPEPAFISMTTSVATMAIEEFTQVISKFRNRNQGLTQRLRRFHIPDDRISANISDPDCQICGSNYYWGIGDVSPFLDRVP